MTVVIKSKIEFSNEKALIFVGSGEVGFDEQGNFVIQLNKDSHAAENGSWHYCTSLAISPAISRKKHGSRVYVKDCGELVLIADDYGYKHFIKAGRDVIEELLRECKENEIPFMPAEIAQDGLEVLLHGYKKNGIALTTE